MRRKRHYLNGHDRRAAAIRAAARDPRTLCAMCGRTLAEHPPTKTGKRQTWHADHVRPGDPTSPLRPVASSCNESDGITRRNNQRTGLETTRSW